MDNLSEIIEAAFRQGRPEDIITAVTTPKDAFDALVYIREHHLEKTMYKIRNVRLGKLLFSLIKHDKELLIKENKRQYHRRILDNKDAWLHLFETDKERFIKDLEAVKDTDTDLFYRILAIKDTSNQLLHDKVIEYLMDTNTTP